MRRIKVMCCMMFVIVIGALVCSRAETATAGLEVAEYYALQHCELADKHIAMQEFDDAVREYKRAIGIDADLAEPHNGLGYVYLLREEFDMAKREYTRAAEINPRSSESYNGIGLSYLLNEQVDAAIEELTKAIELDPQNADAHRNLSAAYTLKAEIKEAIRALRKAIEIEPERAPSHSNLGQLYRLQGMHNMAIFEYKEAIKLAPNDPFAHLDLADIYFGKQSLDEAIVEFKEVLRIEPNFAAAHRDLGAAYGAKGDYDKSLAELTKAIELDPEDPLAHNNLAMLYRYKGLNDKAESAYKASLAIDPDNAETHYHLANLYYNTGHDSLDEPILKKALNEYKETVRCNPAHADAHNMLCHLYLHEGNKKLAIEEGDKAVSIDINVDRYHANLAWAYVSDSYFSEAADELILAQSLDTEYHWAHQIRGHTHYFLEDYFMATTFYEVALSLEPTNPYNILWMYLSLEWYKGSNEAKKFLQESARKLDALQEIKSPSIAGAEWGHDLVRYYTGNLNQKDLLAKATDPWKKCDAHFYIGSLKLLKGDKEAAKQHFLECLKTNVKCSTEYIGANIALVDLE